MTVLALSVPATNLLNLLLVYKTLWGETVKKRLVVKFLARYAEPFDWQDLGLYLRCFRFLKFERIYAEVFPCSFHRPQVLNGSGGRQFAITGKNKFSVFASLFEG